MTSELIDYRGFEDHYQPIRLRTQFKLEQLLRDRQRVLENIQITQAQQQHHRLASQKLLLQLQAPSMLAQLTRQHCLEQLIWQERELNRLEHYQQGLDSKQQELTKQIQQNQLHLETLDQLSLKARQSFATQSLQQLGKLLDEHVCQTYVSPQYRLD